MFGLSASPANDKEVTRVTDWKTYLEEHKDAYLEELIEFLRIPSVSTLAAHREDVRRAAQWTANRLRRAGIADVQIMETGGHPLVYAERIESADKPTVLFYGHFDVQPAEPIELWTHPPFEPHVEDGKIYARAASDMKGNVLLPIIACEAILQTTGGLPLNVKFLIEGEEEIGSPSLGRFVAEHTDLLTCDLTISADGGIGSKEAPKIGIGNRGLAGIEVRVQTATVDLHSGNGGFAPNALHGLVSILNSLRDEEGRILVEGFYDDVEPVGEQERALARELTAGYERTAKTAGIRASFGEPEYSPAERALVRPTLELNGVWGGFQGDGIKTVIPHEAFAKITCRLVPNQDPAVIREQVKAHIRRVRPEYASVTFTDLPGEAFAYRLPTNDRSVDALQQVLLETTGKRAGFGMSGGTVPVMGLLQRALGVQTVTVGASGEGERAHAPNEFLRLENFYRLQEIYCLYLTKLAAVLK